MKMMVGITMIDPFYYFLVYAGICCFLMTVQFLFSVLSYYKYYKVENISRNLNIEILLAFVLGLSNLCLFYYYKFMENNSNIPSESINVFIIAGVLNVGFAILDIISKENAKKTMISQKKVNIIRTNVIKKYSQKEREIKWREIIKYFDKLQKNEIEFDFERLFFYIAIQKYFDEGGKTCFPFFHLSVLHHPYFPEFVRKVKEIPLEKILSHIDEWIQMTDTQ